MNITQARRKLLEALIENGGTIPGSQIGGVGRAAASKMQSAGLVTWEQPAFARGQRDLSLWLLHITDVGRVAVSQTPVEEHRVEQTVITYPDMNRPPCTQAGIYLACAKQLLAMEPRERGELLDLVGSHGRQGAKNRRALEATMKKILEEGIK